jgi:hypothetical protein
MSAALRIDSIAATLDTYHRQLVALSDALAALHEASDLIRLKLEQDRAALATYQEGHVAEATPVTVTVIANAAAAVDLAAAPEALPLPQAIDETEDRKELLAPTAATASQSALQADIQQTEPVDADDMPRTLHSAYPAQNTATDTQPTAKDTTQPSREADRADVLTQAGNVVALDTERRKRRSLVPSRSLALTIFASLLVTVGAGFGLHELLHGDLGQKLIELGACDGHILSADRNCSLIAWLML